MPEVNQLMQNELAHWLIEATKSRVVPVKLGPFYFELSYFAAYLISGKRERIRL